jgi:hypothetical protein
MVSDQIVPLKTSTEQDPIHHISVSDYPSVFSGNQFIINTDRFILNTKSDKILFHSGNGFHVSTLSNLTFDVQKDRIEFIGRDKLSEVVNDERKNINGMKSTWVAKDMNVDVYGSINELSYGSINLVSSDKISLQSPGIFIGTDADTDHPMVFGDVLVELLNTLINVYIKNSSQFGHVASSPVVLNENVITELTEIQKKLNMILSRSNFVGGPPIDFKTGNINQSRKNKPNTKIPISRIPIHK